MTFNVSIPISYTFLDYSDNYSHAVILYFMGCDNDCIDCHNKQFLNPNNDVDTKIFNLSEITNLIEKYCSKINTNKIVFSGGDPICGYNINSMKILLDHIYNEYDVMIYTGKSKQYVIDNNIKNFKFIKCGKYIPTLKQLSEKTDSYIQFSSTNQELYDENLNLISKNGVYYFKENY
jgi:organic radical activating enzyme